MTGERREIGFLIKQLDKTVLQMLKEDLPSQLAAIRQALANNNLQQAVREVHSVHGSAAFCKLEDLRQSAAALERSLNTNEKNDEHIKAFEDCIRIALDVLENY